MLVEPATRMVGAQTPPERQGRDVQPVVQSVGKLLQVPGQARGFARRSPASFVDTLDDGLNALGAVERTDQHRVALDDDRQVLDPDRRDHHAVRGANHRTGGVDEEGRTLDTVSFEIAVAGGPDRIPGAQVRPGEVDGQDGRARCLLHHRVVEGNLRRFAEPGGQAARRAHPHALSQGQGDGRDQLRRMQLELVDQQADRSNEVAAVPETAFLEIAFSGGAIWLLDEAIDFSASGLRVDQFARPDVAISAGRRVRLDPQDHQAALACDIDGPQDRILEGPNRRDVVIGGQYDRDRVGIPFGDVQHGRSDGRT